jgi:nicotinate-nucleotide adenylyltransferase
MKIALFFGSFNPIHFGHLAIANYIVEYGEIDELWFVLSPQNPLKQKQTLLPDYQRLEILNRAIEGYDKFRVSTIEFNLQKPSFTIHTLTYLKEKHPDYKFSLIMGADNIATIDKWKNYHLLLQDFEIIVYPRPKVAENEFFKEKNVTLIDAPIMEISSSFIRQSIKEGKNIRFFMPLNAYEYIEEMNFYK